MQSKGDKFCPWCNSSIKLDAYDKHISVCYKVALGTTSDKTIIELPDPHSYMQFVNFINKLVRLFLVTADFECTPVPIDDEHKYARHVANSAFFYFMCSYDSSKK